MQTVSSARFFSIPLVLALALLVGCAGLPLKKEDPATVLKNRSAAFLQAMVDKNWAVAYEFFESSFKKQVSAELFAAYPRDTQMTGFSVLDVAVSESGKSADVSVTVDLLVDKGFTFNGVKKIQNWIVEKGQWVLVEPAPASEEFH